MANTIMFCILAVVIIGSAIVCVFTKRIMRAATFLLFVLFGVAGVYFLLDYTFLGTAQIAIYAGGLTMLYIFAIQLVSKRTHVGYRREARWCRQVPVRSAFRVHFRISLGMYHRWNNDCKKGG